MANPLLPVTAIGAALVGVVGIGAAVTYESDPYPSEWDERVVELVDFVEDERGHPYEHPVEIEFLTPEEYSDRTRGDTDDLSDEDLESAEQTEGLLRALGLVDGDIDLFESSNDLADSGTLAFYDPATEVVTVRGTEVTPALAITLVHELTHVLQDQVFDLESLLDDAEVTYGADTAYRALVEGDAMRIENLYYESLAGDEQAEADEDREGDVEASEEEAIPEALEAIFGLPYALGQGFVEFLEADNDDAIDDAFRDPPSTEEHLLDPLSFVDGDELVEVSRIATPEGSEVVDAGDFGAASLYLVLASRIDLHQALTAALGWGGDAFLNYVQDDTSCVDMHIVGDETTDTDELESAFTAWAAAGPEGAASVSRDGDEVALHACDPGVDAGVAPGSAFAALGIAASRTVLLSTALDQGASEEFAECYADGILGAFTTEELMSDDTPGDFQERITEVAGSCPP